MIRAPHAYVLAALAVAAGCGFEPLAAGRRDAAIADAEDAAVVVVEDAAVADDAAVEDTFVPDTFADDAFVPDTMLPDRCGDGRIDPPEVCDDGNQIPDDGCADCIIDLGYVCAREPSRCLADDQVTVVDSSTVTCSPATDCGGLNNPCCTLVSAIARNRPALFFRGDRVYAASLSVGSARTLEILAEDGAVLESIGGPALEVRQGSQVVVRGLSMRGGGPAVLVRETGTAASFFECRVGPTAGVGIDVRAGSTVRIERTTVFDSQAGGIKLDTDAAPFRVVNTVIYGNGATATEAGGVFIKKAAARSVFANNSIAGNRVGGANPQDEAEGGIRCDVPGADIVNTIVWDNSGEVGPSTVSAMCRVRFSNLGPVSTSTVVTNFSEDPQFIDESELRIMPLSPCVERGDPAGTIDDGRAAPNDDVDGEQRPINARVDVGADEAG